MKFLYKGQKADTRWGDILLSRSLCSFGIICCASQGRSLYHCL